MPVQSDVSGQVSPPPLRDRDSRAQPGYRHKTHRGDDTIPGRVDDDLFMGGSGNDEVSGDMPEPGRRRSTAKPEAGASMSRIKGHFRRIDLPEWRWELTIKTDDGCFHGSGRPDRYGYSVRA